jgi:hypothetical protein
MPQEQAPDTPCVRQLVRPNASGSTPLHGRKIATVNATAENGLKDLPGAATLAMSATNARHRHTINPRTDNLPLAITVHLGDLAKPTEQWTLQAQPAHDLWRHSVQRPICIATARCSPHEVPTTLPGRNVVALLPPSCARSFQLAAIVASAV